MKFLYALLLFVPIAIAAELMHASSTVVFLLSAAAILPLSGLLGTATEELAGHTGSTIGGLMNATLGNFAELVIAALALRAGQIDLVKASITGSILGNLLLVLGAAQLAGGLKYKTQKINPNLAGLSSTLLMVAVLGLVVPAVFFAAHPDPLRVATGRMSVWVGSLLMLGYLLSLVYSMVTHKAAFNEGGDVAHHEEKPHWSLRKAIVVLVVAAATIGVLSEFLVSSVDEAATSIGLPTFFIGLIVIPIIGNAAEHSSAVLMAMKGRMDLAVGIAVGSSIQVALLIAPVLVFLGLAFGQPMDLAFTVMEVASVAVAVAIASSVMKDSESNWLEGAFLLIAYAAIGTAFFFY
ncbi:MAG: calcium/proton exchanger [Gemmatimonadaceae bacterium]